MDAFFAAVEQRDFPHYRNKPLIVGGNPSSRGVVATCSYEARQYGIHSAMSSALAYRLCPQAVFVKPRFAAYQEASMHIREVFADYTEVFEPLSLDEAYLDVSGTDKLQGSALRIAKAIKAAIREKTQLTASAGISYNKFLAKIASDMGKPDGLYLITPEQGAAFVEQLPINKFHGVGKVTAAKMQALGIYTGKDLKQQPLSALQQHFGKSALHYYHISRGVDNRQVNNHRIRKSVGVETTFATDIKARDDIIRNLQTLLQQALRKSAENQLNAQTVTVKIKYHNFVQITRSRTLPDTISTASVTPALLDDLLKNTEIGVREVRLLGITLSSLNDKTAYTPIRQLDVFSEFQAII